MSLIGNYNAFTSWSATAAAPAQTYNSNNTVPYVAPAPPPVITNNTTGTTTVLDAAFIEQIVRRNQENIYESTKKQTINELYKDGTEIYQTAEDVKENHYTKTQADVTTDAHRELTDGHQDLPS